MIAASLKQESPKRRNLVEVTAEKLGHQYSTYTIGKIFRAARLSKDDVRSGLDGPDTVEWFERVTRQAQVNEARRRVGDVGPATFAELSDEQIRSKVHVKLQKLLDTFDREQNVVIIGPTGCGKSLASLALLRTFRYQSELESIRRNPQYFSEYGPRDSDGYVVDADDPWRNGWVLAHELQSATLRHPLGEGPAPALAKAKAADLLVLDDLQTPARDDTTLEVIWHRYDRRMPTISTCGLPKAKFLDRFGDAFGRRLIESNGERGVFVDCFGGKL